MLFYSYPIVYIINLVLSTSQTRSKATIDEVLRFIEQGSGFVIAPFDFLIFRRMLQLPDEWEIHDRIIGATACYYGVTLITKDMVLSDSEEIKTIW